ncbi:hypothetical protein NQ317_006085 [Molorchus minor]|uniref:Uncharacterized protein n=1 Tax=Molorchus minor TaxID=1323400 RepID=A0ABQ9JQY6_9CUCU|nr:hypothetical protein NQ317_006085 [Molorchus minor]
MGVYKKRIKNQRTLLLKSLDKMKLSILEYMKYLGGSEYSKCEGENVLNAGHLILAGKTEENIENVTINGLCLQSSSLESVPREITGELSLGRTVNVNVVANVVAHARLGTVADANMYQPF